MKILDYQMVRCQGINISKFESLDGLMVYIDPGYYHIKYDELFKVYRAYAADGAYVFDITALLNNLDFYLRNYALNYTLLVKSNVAIKNKMVRR